MGNYKSERREMDEKLEFGDNGQARLLPGENVKKSFGPIAHPCQFRGLVHGSCQITNYRLIFAATKSEKNSYPDYAFYVPLNTLAKVAKNNSNGSLNPGQILSKSQAWWLELECKDLRTVRLEVDEHEQEVRNQVHDLLNKAAFESLECLFCFKTNKPVATKWHSYDVPKEFTRMTEGLGADCQWHVSDANRHYKICETYPPLLITPKDAPVAELKKAAQYRTKCRVPVATWIHPVSGAALLRSSQPQVGINEKKNEADWAHLKRIRDFSFPKAEKLLIFDLRPKINAQANLAKGGGFEKGEFYRVAKDDDKEFVALLFCDIGNIHVMRESLGEVVYALAKNKPDKWWADLDKSGWLGHVRLVMLAVARVAERIESSTASILIHCSDGWDRTAQVSGLSQIMLDGHFRSIDGICTLIDKEWVHFGHKFADRIGVAAKNSKDEERSPVFVQFLDCVHQLTVQFPAAFEFDDTLLLFIANHLYTGRYGNFIHNSLKHRDEAKVADKSESIWTYISEHKHHFVSGFYSKATCDDVLIPSPSITKIAFWSRLYAKWDPRTPENLSAVYARQLHNQQTSL